MARQQRLRGTNFTEINTVCGYVDSHLHRMQYHESLAAGYPMATGVIEGARRRLHTRPTEETPRGRF